ncbi:MAG: SPOR domain-containing protein, partial [Fidelibacterota bacterium]
MGRLSILLIAFTFILFSCATVKREIETGKEEEIEFEKPRAVEQETPVQEEPAVEKEVEIKEELTEPPIPTVKKKYKKPEASIIYRVQISSESTEEKAHETAVEASEKGYEPVHVFPRDDYWKVQVGDFLTREEAGKVKELLVRDGYSDAWIVKIVKELPPVKKLIKPVEKVEVYRIQMLASLSRDRA